MKHHYFLALAPILVGGSAVAQFSSLSLFSNCDGGGASYKQYFEPEKFSPRAAAAEFVASPTADASRLFSHACFWRRVPMHSRLRQFYNDPSDLSSQGGVTFGFGGSPVQWTVTWPQVDDTSYLSATWNQQLHCRGAENQIVINTWVLTNTSTVPMLTIEFVTYVDVDLGDFEANVTGPASPSRQIVEPTPFAIGGPCVEFFGGQLNGATNEYTVPPTNWEIDFFPNIERKLTSPGYPGLTDSGLPFGEDDFTGAMSWMLSIPAGATRTIRYALSRNTNYCETLGSVEHYPATLAFPDTTLSTSTHPWPGLDFVIDVDSTNGLASALMLGLDPVLEIPIPACPTTHTLLVDPTILTGLPISLDAFGHGELLLPGSCHPLFYCGTPLHFQQWALTSSPSACTGLPQLEHSRRLTVTYGSL